MHLFFFFFFFLGGGGGNKAAYVCVDNLNMKSTVTVH